MVEHVADHGSDRRCDLHPGDLVPPAVDRVQQGLGQIHPSTEELHLLADRHRRHAAGDRRVVPALLGDQGVRLVLDGGGVDGHLRTEPLEPLGQPITPEHGEVRLRRRAQVVEGLQHPQGRPGDQRPAVEAHPPDRLGHPGRVAGEQGVVLGGAQEPDDPELDHQIVDELLGLRLGQLAGDQVALQVHVQERRGPTQGHGRTVLLLHRRQIGEVEPLDGFPRRPRRSGDVEPVRGRHHLELTQGPDLLGDLLAVADHVLGAALAVRRGPIQRLGRDQGVDAVERDPAVVADDPTTSVGVRQPGDDLGPASRLDRRRVDVEDPGVVGLAVGGEDLREVGIDRVAVGGQRVLDHPPAAVRHDRPLQRRIGLQTDDDLVGGVDVAGSVRGDGGRGAGVDVVDALLPLGREHRRQSLPQRGGALGRPGQEAGVTGVRRVVALEEVADVDRVPPRTGGEAVPGVVGVSGVGSTPVGVVCVTVLINDLSGGFRYFERTAATLARHEAKVPAPR